MDTNARFSQRGNRSDYLLVGTTVLPLTTLANADHHNTTLSRYMGARTPY